MFIVFPFCFPLPRFCLIKQSSLLPSLWRRTTLHLNLHPYWLAPSSEAHLQQTLQHSLFTFYWPSILCSLPDFISHRRQVKSLLSIFAAPSLNLFVPNSLLMVFTGVINWLSSLIRPRIGDTRTTQSWRKQKN